MNRPKRYICFALIIELPLLIQFIHELAPMSLWFNSEGMFSQILDPKIAVIKQLLDEVEHDIMNYQNRGLCYLPKPKAEADNTDTKFW